MKADLSIRQSGDLKAPRVINKCVAFNVNWPMKSLQFLDENELQKLFTGRYVGLPFQCTGSNCAHTQRLISVCLQQLIPTASKGLYTYVRTRCKFC